MTTPNQLFALQEIDHLIDSIDAERIRVEKRLSAGVNRPDLNNQAEHHQTRAAAIRTNLGTRRDEAERLRERLTGLESRLYNANTSRRDLSAIQREADSAKYQLNQIDELLAELEEEQRAHEEAAVAAIADMKSAETEWEAAISALNNRLTELATNRDDAAGQRESMAGALPSGDLQRYERLRHNKSGTAVALVDNGRVCLSCRMTLPTNVLRQLRNREAQVLCSTCGRILYQP
jgi:predicted  nucleic acid-binding Zn-ribbon protein